MTSTERRQRITAIFELAIKLGPEDQGRFLERECRGDGVLLEQVKSLLSEHRESGARSGGPQPAPDASAITTALAEPAGSARSGGLQPAPDASEARPGPRRIGRYEITGTIGSGGFGHVYSALDPTVGRVVAIKVLNTPGHSDLVKRFRAEAMTVANLHHKNIVTVHEFGEENGAPYLVMEFLEGTNVQDLIRQHTPLSLHEKLSIMSEVAEGLQYAHGRAVIHRDVKPANIMRLSDGCVKIMDFGIARMAAETSTRLTQTGFVVGTLQYMAPEQFNGTSDALTDIFAYGVTFYELLTGRHPFSSTDPAVIMYRIMNAEPDALRSLVPECPESVERIVSRTLAKSREVRYSSLADVVVDTKPILLDLRRREAGDLFSRANELLGGEQLDAAQSAVRRALDLDPWHAEARQLRSRIEQALHHRDLVDRAGALLDRAEQGLSQREFKEAAECLATVKQMSLVDARINARLERAYGQIEQARNAVRLLDAAREDLQKQNLTEAFRAVSEVLASDPGNSTGQQLLQAIQTRMTSREAQRKIQEEIARAECLLLIGETDQALALLTDIEGRAPSHKELSALRARAAAQKADEERARRLTEGVAAVKALLRNRQFDDAAGRIDELLAAFVGNQELMALRRHAAEQLTARKRAEEIRQLKAEAAAWIERGEYDRAIRALEAGAALLGDDGDLTLLLQSAIAGKAAQERERAVSRIVEDTQQFRRQGKFDDALRVIERAIQRWGNDPPLPQLFKEVSDEKERRDRIRDVARRASALIGQKKPDAAIILLRQSIERDGEDPEFRKLLDSAGSQVRDHSRSDLLNALREEVGKLIHDERWEEALRRIDEALREFPDEQSFASQRASVLAAIDSENRERALMEALGRIQSLQRENRFSEATELLEKSLNDHGGDARLLQAQQHLSESLAERQRAEYLGNLRKECLLLLKQGRFDDALRLLEGCEDRYPNSREVSDLLAQAKSAREAHERKQSIETALARASELIQHGDFEAGLSVLEDALRSYPDSRDLAEALARAGARRDKADRQRETKQLTEEIERAIAAGDWSRATNRISAGLERFPEEAALVRLKRTAEDGKHRSDLAEVEASAHNALHDGNSVLAAEIVAVARIRWPDEKKLGRLHQEVALRRADEDVSRAKLLLQSGRYDEAEQLAGEVLRRWPKLASATDLLEEIEARRSARTEEETPKIAGVPDSSRRSWPRLVIWSAVVVIAVGGPLYWVVRPHAKPGVEETKLLAPQVNELKIGELVDSRSAEVGSTYAQTLRTSSGSLPISWLVIQGSLPPGLSLDRQTGRIEGTPENRGTYTFVAQASDSRGHTAQRALTMTVVEPRKDQTPVKQVEVAKAKPADLHRQASSESKPYEPKTVSPVPTTQANVQEPCKAKAFILDQYGDSRSGELTWRGSLSNGGELEIRNRRASPGFIRGDILPPGVPVRVSVAPENIRIVAAPSAKNCWDSRLLLKNSGSPTDAITIKWVVYQP